MTRDILFVKLEHPFQSFIVFAQNDEISKLMTFKTVVICKSKIKDLKKINFKPLSQCGIKIYHLTWSDVKPDLSFSD